MKPIKRTCGVAAALALLCLSGASVSAGGNYYRWIDETGTTVNSDRPPPTGIDYEVISASTNHLYEEPPGYGAETSSEGDNGDSKVAASNTGTQPKFEKDPEYCASARQNLETLNTSARIRVHDDNGGFRFINEEEKEAQRETAESIIAQHCE